MKTEQGRDLENYMAKSSPMSDERIANWWGKLGSRDLIIKHPIQSKRSAVTYGEEHGVSWRTNNEKKTEHVTHNNHATPRQTTKQYV